MMTYGELYSALEGDFGVRVVETFEDHKEPLSKSIYFTYEQIIKSIANLCDEFDISTDLVFLHFSKEESTAISSVEELEANLDANKDNYNDKEYDLLALYIPATGGDHITRLVCVQSKEDNDKYSYCYGFNRDECNKHYDSDIVEDTSDLYSTAFLIYCVER